MPEHTTAAPAFQLRLTPDKPALASDRTPKLTDPVPGQAPPPPARTGPQRAVADRSRPVLPPNGGHGDSPHRDADAGAHRRRLHGRRPWH